MSIISLTTDFGTQDWFVGTMKAVILGLHPDTQIVDITHEIAAGNIRQGAFALMAAASCFPPDTVHVAVVDPGVGTERRAVAVQTKTGIFVSPDNGLLSWALRGREVKSIRLLSNEKFFRHPVSRTFHGRDVFAPVAAHLARGVRFNQLGPEITGLVSLPWPQPERRKDSFMGEILQLDRYGNAITNLPHDLLSSAEWQRAGIVCGKREIGAPRSSYAAVESGGPLAILSSSGFLEIAVNGGAAAKELQLETGAPVEVQLNRGV